MPDVVVTQVPTNRGVFLKIEMDAPYRVIAYVRDTNTAKIWDLKELLSPKKVHTVTLNVPKSTGDPIIVVHPLAG